MQKLHFVRPELKHKELALNYQEEHQIHHELQLPGSAMLDQKESYEDWISWLELIQDEHTLPDGWVTSSTFFVMNEKEDVIIGMMDIRHTLNDTLRKFGGHIGYGVRPSLRRQGNATQMLQFALIFCKTLGLKEVMVTCDTTNVASRKTIEKCGGILEKEDLYDGEQIQIYWIVC